MRISLIVLASAAVAMVVAGGSVAGNTPDTDGDGIFNLVDNCTEAPNSLTTSGHSISQGDTDADGFGNTCDGDFNNNGAVNAQDSGIFNVCFACAAGQGGNPNTPTNCTSAGIDCEVTDLNDNGFVNAQDTGRFFQLFAAEVTNGPGSSIGPSGLPCATKDITGPLSGNMTGRHPCVYDPNGSAP